MGARKAARRARAGMLAGRPPAGTLDLLMEAMVARLARGER